MLTAVITLASIALIAGIGLSVAARRLPASDGGLVEQVNELLPQTQCAQCGFPGCRPYASALVKGTAGINLCPPGGDETVRRLADLLGRDIIPLAASVVPSVAVIDEALCIGCTHCRTACPVDAIVGAHQYMHSVIESECTGCELCVAPCPVDCISMRPLS
jgi:electron transport complex protein RnfB